MGATVVRSRLGLSASRGVLILDQDGNPIVSSEMTGDEVMDPDEWSEPQDGGEHEEEEED